MDLAMEGFSATQRTRILSLHQPERVVGGGRVCLCVLIYSLHGFQMGDTNEVTTRLLTLLNVSGTKIGKRKRPFEDDDRPPEKLNKRKSIRFSDSENHSDSPAVTEVVVEEETKGKVPENVEEETDGASYAYDWKEISHFWTDTGGLYERHFGAKPTMLTESSRSAIDKNVRVNSRESFGKLGSVMVEIPEGDTSVDAKYAAKNDVCRHQVCYDCGN